MQPDDGEEDDGGGGGLFREGGGGGLTGCVFVIVIATVDTHLNGWTANHRIPMTQRARFM